MEELIFLREGSFSVTSAYLASFRHHVQVLLQVPPVKIQVCFFPDIQCFFYDKDSLEGGNEDWWIIEWAGAVLGDGKPGTNILLFFVSKRISTR